MPRLYKSIYVFTFNLILLGGLTMNEITLFKQLVSEINISKYNQKEYADIVNAIYVSIFKIKENT